MTSQDRIKKLLHETLQPGWTLAHTRELFGAVALTKPGDTKLALLKFCREILIQQRTDLIAESNKPERTAAH